MQLQTFRVTNYRNILDSGDVEVGRIAALVGQNECGKSNLLSALNGLNAFDGSGYTLHQDWPIDRWPPPAEPATVCSATFLLDPEDIAELFKVAAPQPSDGATALAKPSSMSIIVSKNYANKLFVDLGEWNEKLVSDKATKVIQERMPKCVYVDEYTIFNGSHPNFPDLHSRMGQPQNVRPEERTLLIALDLAALNLSSLINVDANRRTFFTTASSSTLSRRFSDKWNQREVQFDIRVDGTNLMIYVLDEGLRAPIPLERRSAGFRWYVSFIWRFTHASNGEFRNCILLLDEPGVRLHHAGHADLLAFLNTLANTNAVIYTTHLATMIDPAYPERIRIMEVHEHHGQIINSVVSNQQKPMMVIEATLGLAGGMSGLLGMRQNLI
ncbi:MAG: ATP-dependent nuclease, partial [Candidatus Micrarchaeaceae archaeon]